MDEYEREEKKKSEKYDKIVNEHIKEKGLDKRLWWKNSDIIKELTKDWPSYNPPRDEIQHKVADIFVDKMKK